MVGLEDALGRPLAGAPVEGLALVDDVVHRADRLLDRSVEIRAVAENQIHVVELEPCECGVGSLDHMLARQSAVVGTVAAPEDLGRDHKVGAFPA